jgi:hypothetical protein
MAVNGLYMEMRVRDSAVRYIRAYGECVGRDLMPAFADLEAKAEAVGEAEFDRLGSEPAGDDWDGDMGSLAEAADEKAQLYYDTMAGLSQAVLNLLAVGLFHLLEQELADLCRDGAFTVPPPVDSRLDGVADWYRQHFDLDLRTLPSWPLIDELRLVANATKHAEGAAVRQLRERRPELFHNPVLREVHVLEEPVPWPVHRPLSGEDLYVTPEIFQQYTAAAVNFVSEIASHFEERPEEYYPR